MPTIKELDMQKRKLHEDAYRKKYPNGMFSIQVRENYRTGEFSIQLRWGTKLGCQVFSNAYYRRSFSVRGDGGIYPRIEGSFGRVNNYDSLEKVLKRYYTLYDKYKVGVPYRQAGSYVWACNKEGVKLSEEIIKRYHIIK